MKSLEQRTTRRGRLSSAFYAFALLTLLLLLPGNIFAAVAPSASFGHLRLGNAASPYGFSTAIGDLDADQKPDFAIADRLGNTANGYDYSIEFRLSQDQSQFVRFRSPESALNISVRDLDNDQDLDVILTEGISDRIVGVWINDGHGQFHEGDARDFADLDFHSLQELTAHREAETSHTATLPSRESIALPASRVLVHAFVRTAGLVEGLLEGHYSLPLILVSAPRAPPSGFSPNI